jgi:hypothetical protein
LKERHAKRQPDAHDPELPPTSEQAIERVHQQNKQQVNVQEQHRRADDPETPNSHRMRVPEREEGSEEHDNQERVHSCEAEVEESYRVDVGHCVVNAMVAISSGFNHRDLALSSRDLTALKCWRSDGKVAKQ